MLSCHPIDAIETLLPALHNCNNYLWTSLSRFQAWFCINPLHCCQSLPLILVVIFQTNSVGTDMHQEHFFIHDNCPIDDQRMLTTNNHLGQSLEQFEGNFYKIHNNTTENEWHRSFRVPTGTGQTKVIDLCLDWDRELHHQTFQKFFPTLCLLK